MAKRPRTRRTRLPPDRPCGNTLTGGSLVQSVVFDKVGSKGVPWTPKAATTWARGHGYVAPAVVETPTQYRVRQFDPGYCQYRTVPFGASGISGVIELPQRRPPPAHVVREVDLALLKRDLAR